VAGPEVAPVVAGEGSHGNLIATSAIGPKKDTEAGKKA
jgi:hypothetical protein